MRSEEGWPVQVDDDGGTINVAAASTEELRRAWVYQCAVADRLRLEASELHDQAKVDRVETAQQHRRVAVRLYDVIRARGEDI